MRLVLKCFTATLATIIIVWAFSGKLSAQESSAVLQTVTALPDAPHPQTASTETEPMAGKLSGEHSQDSTQSTPATSKDEPGGISGTVTDVYGDIIPGATVSLDDSASGEHRETVANDNAGFAFEGLRGNVPYRVSIRVEGFSNWTSPAIVLASGQHVLLSDIALKISGQATSVTVYASTEQIAVEQLKVAEQQRVFGFIPNFYVVYDSKNAVPLTAKLKFKLALRVSVDPITVAGVAFMAGIDQAANTPDYVQGAKGYGQRLGTVAADGFSDILIGGAILPSLLHQDPRYFYQGTGTTKSRLTHALSAPFICKGDNGKWQPNYSTIGGNLASSALSNAYYPQSNRGAGLVFGSFAISNAERLVSSFAQEFVLRKLTHGVKETQ
jgi:hypothetical protein